MAARGLLGGGAELKHLRVAAHEAAETASGAGLQPRPHGGHAHQLVDLDGLDEALHRDRPQRSDVDPALGQPQRLAGEADGAGDGQLLHPRCEMGGLADGRVVHAQVVADRADDDLAGVHADTDLDLEALAAPELGAVTPNGLLHAKGRVAGAHGVVFVGDRRPEERHDPIAHHLVDRALVVVNALHHPFEDRIQDLPGLLGVTVGEQLHGALQVGEEDGDLFPFAFEGGLRRENLLGEVPGDVGLR